MIRPKQRSGGVGILGSLAKKGNPYVPSEGFLKCQGFHFDETGSLTKWAGFNHDLNQNTMNQLIENGSPARFTGLFGYTKSDQTKRTFSSGQTNVYLQQAGAWTSILSGQTGTSDDLYDWVVLNDIIYFCNGVDANKLIYDDGVNVHVWNMGITAPATPPTLAAGAGGALTGDYSYKITFYNSTLAHESNPSAVSNTVTLAGQKGSLTNIPISTDPQVNKRRIYRTTTGGATYLYLDEIADNVTTTYLDNTADTGLGTIVVDQFGNGVPPVFKFMFIWKGYLFGVPKNSSTIYFSKQTFPNGVDPNDFRDLDKNDGDVITGINLLNDELIVFKNGSIWNGSGTDRATFGFRKQIFGSGSTGHHSILVLPNKNSYGYNTLIFSGKSGFYTYNGISLDYVTPELEKIYRGLNPSTLSGIFGVIYKAKNMAIWIATSYASITLFNDTLIIFDYVQNHWMTRDISNVKANIMAIIGQTANQEIFYTGGYNGYVYQGDVGSSDDGQPISCEWIDRSHPKQQVDETQKSFYEMIIYFDPIAGTTATLSYRLNTFSEIASDYTTIGTIDLSDPKGYQRFTLEAIGIRVFPRIDHSASGQSMTIRGIEVGYKTLGRVF